MRLLCFSFTLFIAFAAHCQVDSVNQRIFLIGDAGELKDDRHPVIDWLTKHVDWNDEKNTVLYLGDNVYPLGLPLQGDPSYPQAKKILDYEINLVKGKNAKAYFIPGNHDWRNGKLGGWEQVLNQVDYINTLGQKNIFAYPQNGCPGPVQVEISDKVVLAIIDTQWFLFLHEKPGPGSTCSSKTIEEVQTELSEIAATHPNQLLIVAMHHPIYSYGVHGGDYQLRDHIFPFTAINPKLYIPLPVLGSLYPLTRGVFGSIQDVNHPLYRQMSRMIDEAVHDHPNHIIVAGHDHGLQMIMKDSIPYVVSGAGSNLTKIKNGRYKIFSDLDYGFSVIEVYKSGKQDVKFYNLNSLDMNTPTFEKDLKTIVQQSQPASMDTNQIVFDSIITVAADAHIKNTFIRRIFSGENYRTEWQQPISVRVLNMSKEEGGLKPTLVRGGGLSRILQVQDSTGKEWTIRSVKKFPDASLPAEMRQSFAKKLSQDAVSAAYPFGALSMSVFSQASGVPYLRNRLVYLPDDPRLDRFRTSFKNSMAMMQETEPVGVKKSYNTDELVLRLARDNDNHIDQRLVLKARLLDNFVMDFDRNEGQWAWGTRDTGKGKIYYPIPKNRDEVFFVNEGFLPWIIKKPWLIPELQGFQAKANNIKTLNRAARNFDRFFMNELTQTDWKELTDSFLHEMTDSVIERALHQQPSGIQAYHMQGIIDQLKKRRNYFASEMDAYYRFISRQVTIVGTNQRELFTVINKTDGSLQVTGHKIAKDGHISSKFYDRQFDPAITREVRIFGLNDDDRFVVEGGASRIKVRLLGGSGNDSFINNGNGKNVIIYDASFEKNTVSGKPGFVNRIISDPEVNRYNRLFYKYDYVNPGLGFEYNPDDGIMGGARMTYIHQGFRKEPYGSRHYLLATYSLKTSSYHFRYEGDYIRAFRSADLIVRADLRAPLNVTNYFGIGNNTERLLSNNRNLDFYRIRYNIGDVSAYYRVQPQSWMRLNIGPTFQFISFDSNYNNLKYIASANPGNLQNLYKSRYYTGFDARVDINSKNSETLPTRGFVFDAGVRSLFGLNEEHRKLTQLNIDMRAFMSLATKKKLVLATRFGWAHNIGYYEIPQAQFLGETDNLRGYRKQRFAGRNMLFNNTELRVKLADFTSYLFPGSVGFLVFNDVGRVYVENENSKRWHDGYGIGLWLAPINRVVFNFSLAHSSEEDLLPRLTVGFQF